MSLFSRLTGVDKIASRLQSMQSAFTNLQAYNNVLQQSLLQTQFRAQGGFLRSDINNEISFIRNGYQLSSAVYSIVSDIARKAAQIPMKVYEIKSDNELKKYLKSKQYAHTTKGAWDTFKLRQKALTEVPEGNPLQALIDRPNGDDDTSTFYEMTSGFRLLTGNWYWYTPVLDKGADKGKVTEIRIMPSQFTLLYVNNTFPQRVIGYELIIDGVRLLQTGEVVQSRYPNYDWSVDGQQLYGMSPLKAGARTLKRANDSETAGIAQLENGGPAVIITNKSVSPDDFGLEQIGKSKEQFKREYTGVVNKAKVKMMAGDIDVKTLGITPVEMDLIVGEQWNFAMICNLYKVSDTLFNNHAASTESNIKEMRKDSYTRAIIPERQAHADAFNRHIVPAYNKTGKRYFVDLDLSGIPELQPDMQSMATWMSLFPWATPNEKREMFDFGKSTDPNMDKIYVPSGLMPLDDINIQVDNIDNPEENAPL